MHVVQTPNATYISQILINYVIDHIDLVTSNEIGQIIKKVNYIYGKGKW